ncbi:hypothetical protein [Desulfosporosinus sp. Sb-LF]|uniref:hypothetical protein n=1 Tax=Desulfosporosinus sp. Sb-LF TaxID=2560027 RepID=UPI00107F594F|nr:hypothetical protein [Desulfosporosinus sp. Sb-LF]TGE32210.1 hypothetical protein E4K68_13945 [Desulfosporosinus sp. Sb-LF]
MKNSLKEKPFTCKLLIFMHILLGIGAVFGGVVLVIDPSGGLLKMPITILENSPFNNFLIPGIILLAILGIIPLITSYALITKRYWKAADSLNIFTEMHWSWAYSFYIGFALIIWITVECYFVKQIILIHVVYIFIGLIIQALSVLPSVQKYYRVR